MVRYAAVLLLVIATACARATHDQPVSEPQTAEPQPEIKPTAPPPDAKPSAPQPDAKPPAPEPAAKPVDQKTPKPAPVGSSPAPKPVAPATSKPSPPAARPAAPVSPKPAASPGAAPTGAAPPAPVAPQTLDVNALIEQLKATKAIGFLTKISLKNKVDDLMDHFSEYYQGKGKMTKTELRQSYDLLIMKVLSLLQDTDPTLASTIVSSREAIWGMLSDQKKFEALRS